MGGSLPAAESEGGAGGAGVSVAGGAAPYRPEFTPQPGADGGPPAARCHVCGKTLAGASLGRHLSSATHVRNRAGAWADA